jgi:iron complex transport system ATP-binding protein
MADLVVENVTVRLGGRACLSDLSLTVSAGELVVLLGANGAGKSTLLRACTGMIGHQSGSIRLDGVDPTTLPSIDRARRMAFLPQTRSLAWPILVRDVVALGRFAYGLPVGRLSEEDRLAIDDALQVCDIKHLAERRSDSLSGGELSRVHMARALAARTDLILADEPNAALDPLQAWRILSVLADFAQAGGAALVAIHDISLAVRFASRLVLLNKGSVLADGPASQVLTPENLKLAYGIRAEVFERDGFREFNVLGPA